MRGSAARLCDQIVQLGLAEAGLSADRFAVIDRERFAPTEQKLFQPQTHVSQVRLTVGCARRQNDLKYCDASIFVFVPLGLFLTHMPAFKSPNSLKSSRKRRKVMNIRHGHTLFWVKDAVGIASTVAREVS